MASYRGPAISDVAYFLCQSLAVEERRAHEEALVREWYAFRLGPATRGGPVLKFQPVAEENAGKTRVHLDLWVEDLKEID